MAVTAKDVLKELEALGRESYKKMLMNNYGVKQPCFGVRIGDNQCWIPSAPYAGSRFAFGRENGQVFWSRGWGEGAMDGMGKRVAHPTGCFSETVDSDHLRTCGMV